MIASSGQLSALKENFELQAHCYDWIVPFSPNWYLKTLTPSSSESDCIWRYGF